MFRSATFSLPFRIFLLAAFLVLQLNSLNAQHHGAGLGRGIPGATNRPSGVQEEDTLKDFHQVLAAQATSQQIAEFQDLVKVTNAASSKVDAMSAKPAHDESVALDSAIENARAANKRFQIGFSDPQKSALKEITKRLEKSDSDLAQEAKHFGQSLQADPLKKALTDFASLQLALGREMGITLSTADDVTFNLPSVRTPVKLGNRSVLVGFSGSLSQTASEAGTRTFQLDSTVDLTDLQQNISELMRDQLDISNPCGVRVFVQSASIIAAPPASSLILRLHFERWSCMRTIGQSQATELAESDGTVELRLFPVAKANGLTLTAEIKRIQANGMFEDELRSGDLGDELGSKGANALLPAMQAGTDSKSLLPKALQNLCTLQSASFQDPGAGGLKLIVHSQAKMSNEQVTALANELNQTLSAHGSSASR